MSNPNKKVAKCKNCRPFESLSCGEPVYAPCVKIEYNFPDFSSLLDEDGDPIKCATLDDVVEDIYEILEERELDLSDFDTQCLDITGDVTELKLFNGLTDKVCNHETRIVELENICNILDMDITGCGLDLTCLEGEVCDNPIPLGTLKQVLQAIINKDCPTP